MCRMGDQSLPQNMCTTRVCAPPHLLLPRFLLISNLSQNLLLLLKEQRYHILLAHLHRTGAPSFGAFRSKVCRRQVRSLVVLVHRNCNRHLTFVSLPLPKISVGMKKSASRQLGVGSYTYKHTTASRGVCVKLSV